MENITNVTIQSKLTCILQFQACGDGEGCASASHSSKIAYHCQVPAQHLPKWSHEPNFWKHFFFGRYSLKKSPVSLLPHLARTLRDTLKVRNLILSIQTNVSKESRFGQSGVWPGTKQCLPKSAIHSIYILSENTYNIPSLESTQGSFIPCPFQFKEKVASSHQQVLFREQRGNSREGRQMVNTKSYRVPSHRGVWSKEEGLPVRARKTTQNGDRYLLSEGLAAPIFGSGNKASRS